MNLDDLEKRALEMEKVVRLLLEDIRQMKSDADLLRQRETAKRMMAARDAMPPLDISIKEMIEDGRR